ncbi:MAG: UvrB/UvrC motif-containing protein [Phycisphaerales bacterium]
MLCECGLHEATIHEVIITNDQRKVERHLCEQCARSQGISVDPYIPISQLLSNASYIMGQVITSESATPESDFFEEISPKDQPSSKSPTPTSSTTGNQPCKPTEARVKACPSCNLSFARFKSSGILGCPRCYQSFEDRLGPMIERAHEGGCSHVGKVPQRALSECHTAMDRTRMDALLGDLNQREDRLKGVRSQLEHAVEHEDYEQAALLRDELTRLTTLISEHPTPRPGSEVEARPQPHHPVEFPEAIQELDDAGRG